MAEHKNIHRQRILERILLPNFVGCIVPTRSVVGNKINLFDITCDIEFTDIDSSVSELVLDYGEYRYVFRLLFEVRSNANGIINYKLVKVE